MVTVEDSSRKSLIIIQPNRSASWETNKRLIYILLGVSAAISGSFAMMGAWLIIPFAGLEMLGLGAALYSVSWKLSHRHVVHVGDGELRIEKGVYSPREVWCWRCDKTVIHVQQLPHPWDPLSISLCCGMEQVTIGDFLNCEDSQQLLKSLKAQGLAVRGYSTPAMRSM